MRTNCTPRKLKLSSSCNFKEFFSYDEAVAEYKRCACTPLGRLIANRELPVLERARDILKNMGA